VRGHGTDNDCVEVIDIGSKNLLCTFERAGREGTGDVAIHSASDCIGKHGKAKHILHGTDFLAGKHAINLGTCGNNIILHIARGGSVSLMTVHVSFVGSNQAG
jgi:hypothetical protein